MERVWIGLGSNLSNPKKQADCAIKSLYTLPMTKVLAVSSCYRSKPLYQKCQPDFLNMIIILDTKLFPEVLLSYLQYIEKQQGRIRTNVIGESRTLDLDILLFGNRIICNSVLVVPHYDIANREFIIHPLMELSPNLIIPDGRVVSDYFKILPKNELIFWEN